MLADDYFIRKTSDGKKKQKNTNMGGFQKLFEKFNNKPKHHLVANETRRQVTQFNFTYYGCDFAFAKE